MLETLREYAQARLAESTDDHSLSSRHGDWFLRLAEQGEKESTSAEQAKWLDLLEREHENLRLAMEWHQAQNDIESCLRMAAALSWFWVSHGHLTEGRRSLANLLGRTEGLPVSTLVRAKSLYGAGRLAWRLLEDERAGVLLEESLDLFKSIDDEAGVAAALGELASVVGRAGDHGLASSYYEEALTLNRALGDTAGIASALTNLGVVARRRHDYESARNLVEEGLSLWRECGDTRGIAMALHKLGKIACEQEDYAKAYACSRESIGLLRQIGDKWALLWPLNQLGFLVRLKGDHPQARALLGESLTIARELGIRDAMADALRELGVIAWGEGEHQAARALLRESISLLRDIGTEGTRPSIWRCLEALAAVAWAAKTPEKATRAVRLLGAATALREAVGTTSPSRTLSDLPDSEGILAETRVTLGEAAFEHAWTAGRAMTLEQAVAFALQEDSA
jgi:tetratricopeptide (TPR) repeat protein